MGQHLPSRMSLPEVMGDPCASELRSHALALLRAAASSEKLIRSHPGIAEDLGCLRDSVERFSSAVLERLAEEAGIPSEKESISPVSGPMGDYRIDRSSQCWIWMRTINTAGYPVIGRKANGRENVPAKIYWMLAHGPLRDEEIVVRTCGSRLCINPDHGRVTDRREHGAERMRENSSLDWGAVHEIRSTLCASRDGLRDRASELASRFGVGEHSILDVFRNKVWFDEAYTPGFQITCAGPMCDVLFRTTNTSRRYHSKECCAAALALRTGGGRSRRLPPKSPARQAREEATLRAETAAAEAEWSDVLVDEPRRSVWTVASIDQPIGDDGGTLHELLPTTGSDGDPAVQLERKLERQLLGSLTEEAIATMDDAELAHIQSKLVAADVRPSICRTPRRDLQ
jgi:hypothetical protein